MYYEGGSPLTGLRRHDYSCCGPNLLQADCRSTGMKLAADQLSRHLSWQSKNHYSFF